MMAQDDWGVGGTMLTTTSVDYNMKTMTHLVLMQANESVVYIHYRRMGLNKKGNYIAYLDARCNMCASPSHDVYSWISQQTDCYLYSRPYPDKSINRVSWLDPVTVW